MCSPRPQLPVGCPLVAPAPQWRRNYPNNRPPTRAKAISEMGQEEKSPGECDGCGCAYSECATRLFQHSGERLSNEHQPRTDRVTAGWFTLAMLLGLIWSPHFVPNLFDLSYFVFVVVAVLVLTGAARLSRLAGWTRWRSGSIVAPIFLPFTQNFTASVLPLFFSS